MKIYKIRDKKTKLYSTGGYGAGFNESGKTWKSAKDAVLAIKLYCRGQYPGEKKKTPEWEVVEFDIKETNATAAKKLL
jgi:hypothetical protein